ncbi:hypothetical protein [Aeromonas hydrophila]|uniref:hypothetical protein n=1 Tax=Aeromonas hydrophila TaxID=644 RepID=UPI002B47D0C2|nr:hypothetical protein [Aeromonas hydrophila]
MLKFVGDALTQRLVNDALEFGDLFAVVEYNQNSGNPMSIVCYQVKKSLKNTIVCTRDPSVISFQPITLRLKRTGSTSNCHSLDCPKLLKISEDISLRERRRKANNILKDVFPILEFGDDELLTAIGEYWERQQKKAE